MNTIIISGRLVADPTIRTTSNGTKVANIRVAVDRSVTKENANGPTADFFDVVAWRQSADFVNRYFFKGKPIMIQGRLQSRTWQDNNGAKRYAVEIVADRIEFCGGEKKAGPTEAAPDVLADDFTEVGDEFGGQLPFEVTDDDLPL